VRYSTVESGAVFQSAVTYALALSGAFLQGSVLQSAVRSSEVWHGDAGSCRVKLGRVIQCSVRSPMVIMRSGAVTRRLLWPCSAT
jgi:hypothetical protein